MKIIKINAENPEKEKIRMARDILQQGGTLVYPTDTVYGLAANIFHKKAVYNIYRMKKRSSDKPISICLSKTEDIKMVAQLNQQTEKIIRKILPGPYTLILNRKDDVPSWITPGTDKIGIRIPDNAICRELSREFPITTTSANISGHPSPKSAQEARDELDDHPDMIIDSGPCPGGVSSTVLDLTVTPPLILREGAGMEKLL
ncbi:L-threonylcarbamoyladenylate synthase [Methanobacterium petrolearium]|uniref:L-threonylcarbamoyladenylate synthase n=1 Tax=Methanobacterium petrolearium TaxID=710190 RepID=UPI001AE8C89B|nr:L-threonylcarbamoyladenylate synthase [Methanobacterium petrolearium]MBP1946899.1 L-threonylcarbamoyladenylate synthase [Methanobacterium petrolearium]BDZ72030.1 threonylcarbamoyl-AMP synthase [Methanobacterium petrolearium]